MAYDESLQGRRMVVTTNLDEAGVWTAVARLPDTGETIAVQCGYPTEEEARRAAFSAAAAAVDRDRAKRGKP